jgi:hypothetical protein
MKANDQLAFLLPKAVFVYAIFGRFERSFGSEFYLIRDSSEAELMNLIGDLIRTQVINFSLCFF